MSYGNEENLSSLHHLHTIHIAASINSIFLFKSSVLMCVEFTFIRFWLNFFLFKWNKRNFKFIHGQGHRCERAYKWCHILTVNLNWCRVKLIKCWCGWSTIQDKCEWVFCLIEMLTLVVLFYNDALTFGIVIFFLLPDLFKLFKWFDGILASIYLRFQLNDSKSTWSNWLDWFINLNNVDLLTF